MIRRILSIVVVALTLAACGSDTYESVSKDIDDLLASGVQLTAEDSARVENLRATAEQLHGQGKSEDSIQALKEARQLIETTKDADLLRKSEG